MSYIQFKNVEKYYDDVHSVKNVNLEINKGEFVVLVGPSGCGKSTTLRMLAGLEDITNGTMSIDGKEINLVLPQDRNIAMVFQDYALYPHMSVYKNMAFGLENKKVPKSEIKTAVEKAASVLELKEYLERLPRQLSGGQRQRVAVGRAIVRNPKVFLFDEPLSNLDAKLRIQTRKLIAQLHQELEATILYVTHDQVEAMTLGNKIVIMNEGQVMQCGTPEEVYHNPANTFVAAFIGTPPMNLFSGEITDGLFRSDYFEQQLTPSQVKKIGNRKEIILGIRPEHMFLSDEGQEILVNQVEFLGNENLLYFPVGKHTCIIRINESKRMLTGTYTCKMRTEHICLFDAETGQRIDEE